MNKSIRTLFLTKEMPYPPIGGAALRNWQNINIMMKFGSVAVFSITSSDSKLEYGSKHPPDVALWSNHHVNDIPTSRSFWQKIEWWLHPRKHYLTDSSYRGLISKELDRILTEFQPDIVVFEEICLYRYLPLVENRGCHTILDNHNVEAPLFLKNQESVVGIESKFRLSILFNKIKSIEHDFIQKVDQVWLCSDADVYLLQKIYGQFTHIQVIPNSVDIPHYDCVRLGNCELLSELKQVPLTLFFAATFAYPPNQVAAQLLIEQIFPRLQELYPDCRLILAGKFPTSSMLETAKQNSKIVVTGLVQDIRPYMSTSSVVIIPLLEGGGTRLKLLEAFAAGRPVVSTAKGAEGLRVQDGKHLLIRNSVDDLVAGVCELWADSSLGQKLTQNAYELVKAEYSWESVSKKVEQSVQELF